ncbi:ABC transporter permease [Cupriavidus sp. H18C1]
MARSATPLTPVPPVAADAAAATAAASGATAAATVATASAAPRHWPGFGLLRRLFRDKPLGAAGAVICAIFLFCGVFADVLAPYGVNEINMLHRLQPPSWAHPFGTDNLGRDMLSRCLYGAQLSVVIGLSAATLATAVSVLLGILTGYLGGKFDLVAQRFVDAWMSFPDLVILIVVVSVLGPGSWQIVVTLGLLLGIGGSRIVRSAVVSVRENMYVHAAQSMGASTPRILWRHILPNVLPPVIVLFTTRVGTAILAESGLSFLGLGVPPPAPTWGGMLSGDGRTFMFQGPWLALAPGACLTVVVYAINVYGDALRDLLDPRMRGTR